MELGGLALDEVPASPPEPPPEPPTAELSENSSDAPSDEPTDEPMSFKSSSYEPNPFDAARFRTPPEKRDASDADESHPDDPPASA